MPQSKLKVQLTLSVRASQSSARRLAHSENPRRIKMSSTGREQGPSKKQEAGVWSRAQSRLGTTGCCRRRGGNHIHVGRAASCAAIQPRCVLGRRSGAQFRAYCRLPAPDAFRSFCRCERSPRAGTVHCWPAAFCRATCARSRSRSDQSGPQSQ